MSDINQVVVTGRLTRDPEFTQTTGGTSVAKTGVAVEGYKKDAERDDQPVNFIDVTFFGNFAELVHNKARKGDSVTIGGQIRQDRWEAEDGSKRSKVYIVAGSMTGEFMYRKADGSDTPARENVPEEVIQGSDVTATDQKVAATPQGQDDDIPF